MKDWWLDAVAGEDSWESIVIQRGENFQAALPYVKFKKKGFSYVGMPHLTQYLGPWFNDTGATEDKRLSREKELCNEIINKLPKCSCFEQNFNVEISNWLPWYWKNYRQTTRYTYQLDLSLGGNRLWGDLSGNIRREINKAKNRYSLKVKEGSIKDFIYLYEKTFERQAMSLPYTKDFLNNFDKKCLKQKSRKILIAKDAESKIHSAIYLVWGKNITYYLMGGSDPKLRNSGSMSLLMWEAIKFSMEESQIFDFEGSMLEPIEKYFRAFGAKQVPYFAVKKVTNPFLSLLFGTKEFLKKKKCF